jgi:aconitate hydratase
VKDLLASGIAPGSTVHAGSGEQLPLWRAAQKCRPRTSSPVLLIFAPGEMNPGLM